MEMSEKINEIIPALVKAKKQMNFVLIEDQKKNAGGVNVSYAQLSNILIAVTPSLLDNGVTIIQTSEPADAGSIIIYTGLYHESGQYILSKAKWPVPTNNKNIMWGIGSAISYLRRYELLCILGLSTSDDDNAVQAGKYMNPPESTQPTTPNGRPQFAPQGQADQNNGNGDLVKAFEKYGISETHIAGYLDKPLTELTEADKQKLRTLYPFVKEGRITAKYFEHYTTINEYKGNGHFDEVNAVLGEYHETNKKEPDTDQAAEACLERINDRIAEKNIALKNAA